MSNCAHLDERDAARAAIARIAARPDVLSTDLLTPDTDATNRWTVEIALESGPVPAALLAELADEGLSIHEAGPRRQCYRVVAVV